MPRTTLTLAPRNGGYAITCNGQRGDQITMEVVTDRETEPTELIGTTHSDVRLTAIGFQVTIEFVDVPPETKLPPGLYQGIYDSSDGTVTLID